MICGFVQDLYVAGGTLRCTAPELAQTLGGIAAIVAIALIAVWCVRAARGLAFVGAALAALGATAVGVASGMPVWTPDGPSDSEGHLAVLLDLSESTRREGLDAYNDKRRLLARRVGAYADALDAQGARWTGSVIGFGTAPQRLSAAGAMTDTPRAVSSATLGTAAGGSDLAGALQLALQDIAVGSGRGAIFALTDGWSTEEVPEALLQRAQTMGVPFHVLPHGAQNARTGLISAKLGPERRLGEEGVARLTVAGGGQVDWTLDGVQADPLPIETSDGARAVRLPVVFAQRGLRLVDLSFAASGAAPQTRSLFTLVRGPARVLAYGPSRWLDLLPPDSYVVTRADPSAPIEASAFDAVVVDSLSPTDFAPGAVDALVSAGLGGTGIFVVNGPLRGNERDKQRLSDWENSSLGLVLPVSSDLATYLDEPPPRDILIVIDTSGSMNNGMRLTIAKVLAARIVDSLRPVDKLRILTFAGAASEIFRTSGLTPSDVNRAKTRISQMTASGGTGIDAAVLAANSLGGSDCHIFFIGDDENYPDRVQQRPVCTLNTYGVAGSKLSSFDSDWGEAVPVSSVSKANGVEFTMLEPKEYDSFWREGPLTAIPADHEAELPASVQISGVARAYLRPECETKQITREPPRDPVLVFRHDPAVRALSTAVFLGDIETGRNGAAVIEDLLDTTLQDLIGWNDPDLYDIRIDRAGNTFGVRITALGNTQPPETLGLTVDYLDGTADGLDLRQGQAPGTFAGQRELALSETTRPALLHLTALGQREQSIPILLPPRRAAEATLNATEAQSQGINTELLSMWIAETNGGDLTLSGPSAEIRRASPLDRAIWPLFLVAGLILATASLFLGGMRR